MFNKYYQSELSNLRELAAEFSKAHPAIAPMLSGVSSDPDVERLLEGVAFLTGLLRRKLDDEFPEIVHSLLDVVFPHYLKPVPSCSILKFSSPKELKSTVKIPKGTAVASVKADDVQCQFQTVFDLNMYPINLKSVREGKKGAKEVELTFETTGAALAEIKIDRLMLYFAGGYSDGAELLRTLDCAERVRIEAEGAPPVYLRAEDITMPGFEKGGELLPYPKRSFSGYRMIQEFFMMPQKFLYMGISGFDRVKAIGVKKFSIIFELKKPSNIKLRDDSILLNTTPIINIFKTNADPISLNHKKYQYKVSPSGGTSKTHSVYSVDSVVGSNLKTGEKKVYSPFESFQESGDGVGNYRLVRSISPVTNVPETFLSFVYSTDAKPDTEVVSLKVTCTNGHLPEQLQVGDVRVHLLESPANLEFANIAPMTAAVYPPIGEETLWRFLSHMSMNYLSMATKENMQKLLELYIFDSEKDKMHVLANRKRVQGIEDINVRQSTKIVRGMLLRGQEVDIRIRQDHFTGLGDMYVFGMVLNYYFSVYSSMNTYVRLKITDTMSGEEFTWRERHGERLVI